MVEANKIASKINPKEIRPSGGIHFDYLLVYLDMVFGYPDFKTAIEISDKYKEYPVFKWRKTFLEVRVAIENRGKKLKTSLKKSTTLPHLDVKIEGPSLIIHYSKTRLISIRYYIIDMEVLFSMNPFIKSSKNDFGIVQPSHSEEIKLEKSLDLISVNINSKFTNTTTLIEVLDPSTNTSCSVYHISCSMNVNVYENIGNLDVFDPNTGSPISMVTFYHF
jgi:hypothetical protein